MAGEGSEETSNKEAAGVGPLNIATLVQRYHHFLSLVWPFVVCIQNVAYILSWESPQRTLQVWFVLFLLCCSVGKYCLLLLCLAAIVAMAVTGYLSHLNHTLIRDQHRIRHSGPTHPSKVYEDGVLDDSTKYKIAEERRKRTLLDCRAMIRDLLAFLEHASGSLEFFYDVLSWHNKRLSAIFYLSLVVGLLSVFLFPMSLCLCTWLCLAFGVNPSFVRVLQSIDGPNDKMTDNDDSGQDCTGEGALPPVSRPEILIVDPDNEHFANSAKTETIQAEELAPDNEDTKETTRTKDTSPSGERLLEDSGESIHRGSLPENGGCFTCQTQLKTYSNKRKYCRNCGNQFCQKCCNKRVPKSALGATSPAARKEKVLVCNGCWTLLNGHDQEPQMAVR